LTSLLTRSPISHTAIGFENQVLDPSIGGNLYWPLSAFVLGYKGLSWVFSVPVPLPPRLLDFVESPRRPKPILPTLIRWVSRGLFPTRDCVQVVCRCLRDAGLPVPNRMTTPAQLFDWLRGEGYEMRDCNGPIEAFGP
jgi:hypothetical protein